MRDDSARWREPRSLDDLNLQCDGLHIRHVKDVRLTLVSGLPALETFQDTLGKSVGWPVPAVGDAYAIALRRDRALLINGPDLQNGWNPELSLAVSDVSGGQTVFALRGTRLPDLLARGAELLPSRSAQRLFAGMRVALYHHGSGVRLHVDRAETERFLTWAERTCETMQDSGTR